MRLSVSVAAIVWMMAATHAAFGDTRAPGVYVQGFVTSSEGKLTYVDLTQSFATGVALPATGSDTVISFNTGNTTNRLVAWRLDIVESADNVFKAVLIARTDAASQIVRAVWKRGESPPTVTIDDPGALWIVRRWPQVSAIGTSFAGSGLVVPGAIPHTMPGATSVSTGGVSIGSATSAPTGKSNNLVETIAVDVQIPTSAPENGQVRVAVFGKELLPAVQVKFKKLATEKPLQARGAFVLTDDAGAGKIDDQTAIAADNDSTEIFSRLEAIAGATGIK